jgi:hypothetical protein
MRRKTAIIGIGCVATLASVLTLGATAHADDGRGADGTRVTSTDDTPWGP